MMTRATSRRGIAMASALLGGLTCGLVVADVPGVPPADRVAVLVSARKAVDQGVEYLVGTQRPDGAWEAFGRPHPAITALAVKAVAQHPRYGPNHPAAVRGIEYVLQFARSDGGIYVEGEGHNNYHTSVALMALASMDRGRFHDQVRGAQTYLKSIQWDEEDGHEHASNWYGGQGYGKHKRPDLSNTQLMLEALHQSGLPADDPAYKKAMLFISRCQMLGTTNDQEFAKGTDDGGFIYSPCNGGESKAGVESVDDTSRLRSYGSMTYAGFKSMLYARVDRDDERVRRAVEWIRRNYTLDQNPNMPAAQAQEGLYYYYHVFAKAMHAWGEETFLDAGRRPHQWRLELCAALAERQRPDGSWVNEEDRWYEGNPHLVTSYSVLALQTALDSPVPAGKNRAEDGGSRAANAKPGDTPVPGDAKPSSERPAVRKE